jgi:hypothetical protein
MIIASDEIAKCVKRLRVAPFVVRPLAWLACDTILPNMEDPEKAYKVVKRLKMARRLEELRLKASFFTLLKARNDMKAYKETLTNQPEKSTTVTITNFIQLIRDSEPQRALKEQEKKAAEKKEPKAKVSGSEPAPSTEDSTSLSNEKATVKLCHCQNIKCRKKHPQWCSPDCTDLNCSKRHCDFCFDGSMRDKPCVCYYTCKEQKCRFAHAPWCNRPFDCKDANCEKRHCWENAKDFLRRPRENLNSDNNHQRKKRNWKSSHINEEPDDEFYFQEAAKIKPKIEIREVDLGKEPIEVKQSQEKSGPFNIINEPLPKKRFKEVRYDFINTSEKVFSSHEPSDDEDSGESQFLNQDSAH